MRDWAFSMECERLSLSSSACHHDGVDVPPWECKRNCESPRVKVLPSVFNLCESPRVEDPRFCPISILSGIPFLNFFLLFRENFSELDGFWMRNWLLSSWNCLREQFLKPFCLTVSRVVLLPYASVKCNLD